MDSNRNIVAFGGAEGAVKWGYHAAMKVAAWRFTGSGQHGGSVSATVVERHEFRLSQTPLTLALRIEGQDGSVSVTRWPVRSLQDNGDGTVTVSVGPREGA